MSSYPAEFSDETGAVRLNGSLDFTDPDNQPAVGPPFSAAASGDSVLWKDSPDGDPIIDWDADTGQFTISYKTHVQGDFDASGSIDGSGLGPTPSYVTVQAGPPDPLDSYTGSPLMFDSTAVSGGLYAWDGGTYRQVGGPLA